ncbi:CHAT domain-containing protein [Streptomyces muensis]|uniref:CHAT domain-containing protein n=1 Tax=Streptomyces muensis TaxID=1077944 RepID=A0A9X1TN96_STRM4|nr:CHAT domain-containing protein [Streptomyces muensis]MCF1596484.1 CHAT domain-containing protein [Streptomyces muensis]
MTKELRVRVVQDPSSGFTALDERAESPDITVCLDIVSGDRIRARLYGSAVPSLFGTEHRADLSVRPDDVRSAGARLCRLWKELVVDFRPPAPDGHPDHSGVEQPYASGVDLSTRPPGELYEILDELAVAGAELLFGTLLGGPDRRVQHFAAYLAQALAADDTLRVRFDSELYIPWPMVCLRPEDVPPPDGGQDRDPASLFRRFLGHRHRIEQTGGAYPWLGGRHEPPVVPSVSLNHDVHVDRRGRTKAADVAVVLAKGTRFVERTTRSELVRALSDDSLNEHLMYFWCHGHFVPNGSQPACLALKLTDQTSIDAQTVRDRRRRFGEGSPFQPFVVLNACHAGVPEGGGDLAFLGRELIHAGARGVLGPQIEIPQLFAAEYALEFVTRYLHGAETAGAAAHAVARRFADELRNPLGLTYALHHGMDTRLERAAADPADGTGSGQEVTV